MARLNNAVSPSTRESSLHRESTPPTTRRQRGRAAVYGTLSPSSAASSDKENRLEDAAPRSHDKGKGLMPPPKLPTPNSDNNATPRNKRRRLGEHNIPIASQTADEHVDPEDILDLHYYNPDQDGPLRREIRTGMRRNMRDLNDRRDELLAADSREMIDLVNRQNRLMAKVRQTSDATIDSRFLVSASDITLRKTTQLALGDASTGVDVDEFVSKCITFMRNGGPLGADDEEPASTQARRQRRRTRNANSDDEDFDGDDGDALAWEVLGEKACFPNNRRPPVPGFLLGPLSVQKRARTATQRRERNQRNTQGPATKPQELQAEDLERAENSNLTTLCKNIRSRLVDIVEQGQDGVEAEASDDMTEEEVSALMNKWHVRPDGGVSLFEFAINPTSFGQTVENLFYISFLIREGSVRINKDDDGLPTLHPSVARSLEQQRQQRVSKHQAVFSLDWPTWERLKVALNIQEPLIPHRSNDEGQHVTAHGWYG